MSAVGAGQPAVLPALVVTMLCRSLSCSDAGAAVVIDTWFIAPLVMGPTPYSPTAAFQ